jgi:hypothetical protein
MLKKLIKGRIYLYVQERTVDRQTSFEALLCLESPSASLKKDIPIALLFSELASTTYISSLPVDLNDSQFSNLIKEVKIKDLPLYINWPYKTPEFMDLLKGSQ